MTSSYSLLLTGATGFVGPRLLGSLQQGSFASARFLVWDYEAGKPSSPTNIDICSAEAVEKSVAAFHPTHVVHLAAQSHVPTSFADPGRTWEINVMGTLHLLEAVKKYAPSATVIHISSAEVYGNSFQAGAPLDETALLQPVNPYAASKAAADLMAGQYASLGLKVIRLRPFNHIGVGQSEEFVASAFAAQIARIEAGLQEPVLRVGNLEARREFLDVDDVIRAYALALELSDTLPTGLIINLCRGESIRIADLLDMLLKQTRCTITVQPDPKRMRPSDIPATIGSAETARTMLHWEAEIPLEQTLRTVLDDWRRRIRV